jgi:phosphatidate cytidylyltransferase
LFYRDGVQPAAVIVVVGVAALSIGRAVNGFASAPWLISLIVMIGMSYHLIAYERGRDASGTEFGVTLGGVFYLGWIGAYFISLRALDHGKWWLLIVLPSVWAADTAAYFIGSRFGRHKLCPRLSPKKSWEGYLAGIGGAVLAGVLFAILWKAGAASELAVTPWWGALIGLAMGVLPTLGDLGESMIKRQVGTKDSSNLLPGHGGVFDRIDSWLWAVVIGYYLVVAYGI